MVNLKTGNSKIQRVFCVFALSGFFFWVSTLSANPTKKCCGTEKTDCNDCFSIPGTNPVEYVKVENANYYVCGFIDDSNKSCSDISRKCFDKAAAQFYTEDKCKTKSGIGKYEKSRDSCAVPPDSACPPPNPPQ